MGIPLKSPKPILDQLKQIVDSLEYGDCDECNMLTIITQDKETGILSISSLTEDGVDDRHSLFASMAKCLGYARVV